MSDLLYRANPSVWRTHPLGVLLVWLVALAGAVIAITGEVPFLSELLAGLALPLPLPAGFDAGWDWRYLGYALLVLAGLRLALWWLASISDRLEIRTDELIWSHGLLSRTYTEIKMTSIRTVRVHQSLLQRLLGAGDLVILTAGDVPELSVRGLPRPREIRDHIKGQSNAA